MPPDPNAAPVTESIGPAVALEWYDGPAVEIALVTDGPEQWLQLVTTRPVAVEGERVTLWLTRENVQAALDLLDGKPVTDYRGEWHGGGR